MSKKTDKLNQIFEQHKGAVEGFFHSFLWAVMIEDTMADTQVAISMSWDRQLILACADGGYISTPCSFKKGVNSEPVMADLNAQLFGLMEEGVWKIIAASMRVRVAS